MLPVEALPGILAAVMERLDEETLAAIPAELLRTLGACVVRAAGQEEIKGMASASLGALKENLTPNALLYF